jgi:amidophosphoribosyltransferase
VIRIGIRPLCMGHGADGTTMLASESVALEGTGFTAFERDVAPGEAVFVTLSGAMHARQCAAAAAVVALHLRIRLPGAAGFGAGRHLGLPGAPEPGETLAKRVISTVPPNEIDVVIPIPESSRPSATQLAHLLGKPYREGFVKNRYVGRTFIMPGQEVRKKSVRQKLNAIASEFKGPQRAAGR